MGKHRKLMPTAAERLIWGFGDGSRLPVFDTPIGRLGAVICWENYMPLLRMTMYSKGIELYCAPTADDRDTWIATTQHIALERRCFVLSCCQFARRSDFPPDYETPYGDEPDTVICRGGSAIVSPLGAILAGPTSMASGSTRPSRHGRDCPRQVRLQRGRPLCAARRLSAARRRAAGTGRRSSDPRPRSRRGARGRPGGVGGLRRKTRH